jgi:hypothetical protein
MREVETLFQGVPLEAINYKPLLDLVVDCVTQLGYGCEYLGSTPSQIQVLTPWQSEITNGDQCGPVFPMP